MIVKLMVQLILSTCAASNRVLMVMQFAGFSRNHGDRVGEVVLVLASHQCLGNLLAVSISISES